jgi:hypothetical protein
MSFKVRARLDFADLELQRFRECDGIEMLISKIIAIMSCYASLFLLLHFTPNNYISYTFLFKDLLLHVDCLILLEVFIFYNSNAFTRI